MNPVVSVLQPQRLLQLIQTPLDLLRVGVWSFALLNLMFLVPQEGFHWIVWYYPAEASLLMPDALSGALILLGNSLLPVVILLEAWRTYRGPSTRLSFTGIAVFTLASLAGTTLLGLGLPLLYTTYLYPGGHLTAYPYLMMLGGFAVWVTMAMTRSLVVRPAV